MSEGGEARERVMEGGLARPLVCLRLDADRSRSREVDVAVVVPVGDPGPAAFRLLTTMIPGEPDAKSPGSSSLVVPERGLHVADPSSFLRTSTSPAVGNGYSKPLLSSKSVSGVAPSVGPGPAPGPEPAPLACFSLLRPMRGECGRAVNDAINNRKEQTSLCERHELLGGSVRFVQVQIKCN